MIRCYRAPKAQASNLPLLLLSLCALVVTLVAFATRGAAAADLETELKLEVEGQLVEPETPPMIEAGRTLVPLRVVAEALSAQVAWEPARKQATVTLPPGRDGMKRTVLLTLGAETAEVNGQEVPLQVPARIVRDRTYIPLRFVAESLGAEVEWDEPTRTVRVWRQPSRVTDLSWQKEVGVARVRVALSEPVLAHSVEVLPDPDRLVVTLSPALVAVPNPANLLFDPLIKGIRLEQDGRVVRLVVDVNRSPDYRLVPDPDGLGFTLELGYQITGIEMRRDGRVPVLAVLSDGPLDVNVSDLRAPTRLVMDFKQTSVGRQVPKTIPFAGVTAVTQVRTGQFTPKDARVVLDLSEPVLYQIQRTDHGVFLRFPSQIKDVSWEPFPGLTRVTLSATGPLDFTVEPDPKNKRLTVSLPGAALGTPATRTVASGAAFTAVNLIPEGSSSAGLQMVFELPYYLGHHIQSKPGEHQLVLDLIQSPVFGKRIWIDAGHGGRDPGTLGVAGTREKDVTLAVSRQLQDLLVQSGADVRMSRVDDREVDLHARPSLANQAKADLFISVHANSGGAASSGTETYYWTNHPASLKLADTVHRALVRGMGLPDRKVRRVDYVVLVKTTMPSILVELGFMSNAKEEQMLRDPGFQRKAAEALREGIFAYYGQGTGRQD